LKTTLGSLKIIGNGTVRSIDHIRLHFLKYIKSNTIHFCHYLPHNSLLVLVPVVLSWGKPKIPPADRILMDPGHKARKNPSDNADLGLAHHQPQFTKGGGTNDEPTNQPTT